MYKLMTDRVRRWAKKERVTVEMLHQAINNLEMEHSVSNLGSGLFKVRMARPGEGKSGGYRTLIVYRVQDRAIVVSGYKKSEIDNINDDEVRAFKLLAKELLGLTDGDISRAIAEGVIHRL